MNEEGTDLPTEIADRRPRWMQSLSTTPLCAFIRATWTRSASPSSSLFRASAASAIFYACCGTRIGHVSVSLLKLELQVEVDTVFNVAFLFARQQSRVPAALNEWLFGAPILHVRCDHLAQPLHRPVPPVWSSSSCASASEA